MVKLLTVGRKLVILSMLTILLTGILAGFGASWPMYNSVRSHIEQTNLTNAQARAMAVNSHLQRYHSLAAQFTSRTEIRKRLEAYLSGELELQQLREFSSPRLAEPASHITDLLAMVRTSRDQQLVAAVGPMAQLVAGLAPGTDGHEVVSLEQPDMNLLRIEADIISPQQGFIGTDSLFFAAQDLQPLLSGFATYADSAMLSLINHNTGLSLQLDDSGQEVLRLNTDSHVLELLNTANASQQGLLESLDKHTLLLVPLPDFDYSLLISIPSNVFYQAAYTDAMWAYVSVLFMLVFGSLLSYKAVRPLIDRLTRQAEQINTDALELKLAAGVFEQTTQAIVVTDTSFNILRCNNGALTTLGREYSELHGQNLKQFLLDQACDNYQLQDTPSSKLLEHSSSWQGEVCYKKKHSSAQEYIPTLQNISGVKDAQGQLTHLIHIFSDITERKAIHNKIIHMAHHDALTGMPNRTALMERLHTCVENKEAFAVLFIDLDKFKPVNDTHGHQTGDELLRQVARRIRACLRSNDVVGRLGGDEFLMIIESSRDSQQARVIASKIIDSVTSPYSIDGHDIRIGVSIGIAYYPKDAVTSDLLIQSADAAMYRAKQSGGNTCFDASES